MPYSRTSIGCSVLLITAALSGCGRETPPEDYLNQEVYIPAVAEWDASGITVRELCNYYQPTCDWEALSAGNGYIMRTRLHDQMAGKDYAIAYELPSNYDSA